MTLDCVQKSKGGALECGHCDGKVSSYESLFMSRVRDLEGHMGHALYTVTEAKLLKGKFGAADFYFPDYNLAVHVDGEHHFRVISRDDSKNPSNARDQSLRDEMWNRECVTAGVNVWRVHYKDAFAPSAVLNAILLRARCNKGEAFVEYSRGFKTT